EIAKYLSKSSEAFKEFKIIQDELNEVEDEKKSARKIPLDVDTRWHSCFLMLQTAWEFKPAIDELVKRFQDHLLEFLIQAYEWNEIKLFIDFLKPFYVET